MDCPNCGAALDCENSVDLGVGADCFEWSCPKCGAMVGYKSDGSFGLDWVLPPEQETPNA